MDAHTTRYATTVDGLSIAYQRFGDGPTDLLFVPGFASHIELFWELPGYAHTFRRLGSFTRFAVFDKRGTGLSDRTLGTGTLEERMHDIEAVVDAGGGGATVLLGASEGAGLSVLYAATHPERVDALVLLGGAISGEWVPPELPGVIERTWGTGQLLQRFWLNGAGDLDQLGRIERAMGTPRAMAELMRHNAGADARPLLPSVPARTLVLHCVGDPVVPVEAGREIARLLPDAHLVEIPGAFHGSNLPAEMDRYVDEIETFLTGIRPEATVLVDRVLATVLVTDIVGSTGLAASLGDHRWRGLLDEHDQVARRVVAAYRGRWIKSTGDGILATFDGPARAVAAAARLAEEVAPLGLQLRAGVHAGEIERRGDDIAGIAVHLAARIADVADDGEVWVSSTVPGLVVGSGLTFEPRGSFALAGVPSRWELAALAPAA